MADPTGAEIQRNMAWMRGNLEKTPKGMNPDIANMVRDVRNMYFPGETRPVGATPAMQSAVQGQPLPAAGEPVRPAPAMRTLAQGVAPQGQPRGYSGMAWSAPTATEMPGLGPQSATPDLTTRYSTPAGPQQPGPSDMIQKMGQQKPSPGFWDNAWNERTVTGASAGEEASGLRKAAGAAGLAGAALTGGLGTWMKRTPAAIPVIAAGGIAQEMMDPASRYSQALKGIREGVKETYRTEGLPAAIARQVGGIIPAAYETLGAAGAPFEKMAGSALRNFAIGTGIAESPTQAMARAREIYNRDIAPTRGVTQPTLGDAMNPQPTPGAPSTINITRGGTPAAEPGGQITVRRGTQTPQAYSLDPQGNVIGPAQAAGGAGLTPAEQTYNANLARAMELENQRQAIINDEIAYQAHRGGYGRTPPNARLITAMMGGKAAVSGTPLAPPKLKPLSESDLLTGQGRQAIGQIGQLDDDFATRTQQLQQQHPNWTPEQIAADPEVRRNRLRKQQIQDQFKNIIELSGKKLPTLDQVLAGQYRGE